MAQNMLPNQLHQIRFDQVSCRMHIWFKTMKTIISTVVLVLAMAGNPALRASVWYAAPNATATGNGSITNPWPLQVALSQTNIAPGDTLYLRGGNYMGPGFASTLNGNSDNYIVVSSYPGEWAVITDGQLGTLLTSLPATTADAHGVSIAQSDHWLYGSTLAIGLEQLCISGTSATNWTLTRGWNGSVVSTHSPGDAVKLNADFLAQNGNYVMFRDFEITASAANNRVVGTGNFLGSGLNLSSSSLGNKAVNLIIHNVGHPGIGCWEQGDGGEINGCLIWGNGMYDYSPSWGGTPRGAGIYTQNRAGHMLIKNNIIFDNLSEGTHAYGESATASGYRFINNIYLNNANKGQALIIGTAKIPTTDDAVQTNYFGMNVPYFGYQARSNTAISCVGNVFVATPQLYLVDQMSGSVSNNTFLYDHTPYPNGGILGFQCTEANKTNLAFQFDWNHYYAKTTDNHVFSFRTADVHAVASDTSGKVEFSGDGTNTWSSWTGWDSNGTYQDGWPANYLNVAVQALDYDSNQFHICVIANGVANTTITPSNYGFTNGDLYELVDAQNWPVVVASGTYTNGTINLPLNLTIMATIPGVTNFVPQHSNLSYPGLFNAFILRRTHAPPRPEPPTDLHVVPLP